MRFKSIFVVLLLLLMGGLVLALLVFVNLPGLVETRIRKRLPAFLGPDELHFDISKIGLSSALVTNIRLGKDIRVDFVGVDYRIRPGRRSPAEIIDLGRVTISGLQIHLRLDEDNRLMRPVISGDRFQDKNAGDAVLMPSVMPQAILIQNSAIKIHAPGRDLSIPLEAVLFPDPKTGKLSVQGECRVFGDLLTLRLDWNPGTGLEFMRIEAPNLDLNPMIAFIPKESGDIHIDGLTGLLIESSEPARKWHLSISRLDLSHPEGELSVSDIAVTSEIDAGKGDCRKGCSAEVSARSGRVELQSRQGRVRFPEADISGSITLKQGDSPQARLRARIEGGEIQSEQYRIKVSGISVDLPLILPHAGNPTKGRFSISEAVCLGQYRFSASGTLAQVGSKNFQSSGQVWFKNLPPVQARFSGELDIEKELRISTDFEVPSFEIGHRDVQAFLPWKRPGFNMAMTASAKGRLGYDRKGIHSGMQVDVTGRELSLPDMGLIARNIRTRMVFNDLLRLQSVPGQDLTIESIDVGKIRLREAVVRYSLENTPSLLVENIQVKWCNGLVSTESIRFPQENQVYTLTLFCDRLELTDLLKQMGVFHAEGSGTLNGRIPVVFDHGNIAFNNGFLFSTPGNGGKIVIRNTDRIMAGIPVGNTRFFQLDLAAEALKDFDYNWAKLTLNSQGDNLMLNMELDGKPAGVLPFEYREDMGGFVRMDASGPGSNFQGIRLDVRLTLPFNEVLKWGQTLRSTFN